MVTIAKEKPRVGAKDKKSKQSGIFITLDDVTAAKLKTFMDRQRVQPTKAAIALAALTEFLNREVPN